MKVILSGNTAKLYVNGAYKAQYTYPATFTGGKVGFRTVNAITYFDNFLVSAAEINRTTYAVGGQVIATRISGAPTASNNGLFYLFSDHLGSTSVLATTAGSQVPGSRATYYPFGSPAPPPPKRLLTEISPGRKRICRNSNFKARVLGNFANWSQTASAVWFVARTICKIVLQPSR